MKTARRYIARELYRSCVVVVFALVGLFTFFSLVDKLDRVSGDFRLIHLLYLEILDLPTRLYDLLPIGLLIGSVLALAGLAQRHELVILRVSGVSAGGLLRMLWVIALPLVAAAILLAEFIVPATELKLSEANLSLLGRTGGGRLESGYWFKERTPQGERVINVGTLLPSGNVRDVLVYELDADQNVAALLSAEDGSFSQGKLLLSKVTDNSIEPDALQALSDAKPTTSGPVTVQTQPSRTLDTSLTPQLLMARVLTPERMSVTNLWRYIDYLKSNRLSAERQIVAVWRKAIYPFTLLIMVAIAAPISVMQTRRGGVGGKVFAGILAGVTFFMPNQLALNAGMLYGWPPWATAIVPNLLVFSVAFAALLLLDNRNRLILVWRRLWPWADTLDRSAA
nr:LPS export ABC transporter permease LptG [Pseudomonas sp.]